MQKVRNHEFQEGAFRFRVEGVPHQPVADLYHVMLAASWQRVLFVAFVGYLGINLAFALLYTLGGDCIAGARPYSFSDNFFFSIQTISTIGYGSMSPRTLYAHLLVTAESFTGLSLVAMGTGLMFAKFARPRARVAFAECVTVHERDGCPCLHVRLANERSAPIVDARIHLYALVELVSREGLSLRRPVRLKLDTEHIPLFLHNFVAIHRLDETSPLYGLSQQTVAPNLFYVIATFTGIDDVSLAQVHARWIYRAAALRFGESFRDMVVHEDDGSILVQHQRLHETEPLVGRASRSPGAS